MNDLYHYHSCLTLDEHCHIALDYDVHLSRHSLMLSGPLISTISFLPFSPVLPFHMTYLGLFTRATNEKMNSAHELKPNLGTYANT